MNETDRNAKPTIDVLAELMVRDEPERPLHTGKLAHLVGVSEPEVELQLEWLAARGLVYLDDEWHSWTVTAAGHQYLADPNRFDENSLEFLPNHIDDLEARSTFIAEGNALIAEFQCELLAGEGSAVAAEIVPPGYEAEAQGELALQLFGAACSVLSLLAVKRPAGCLAEEFVVVAIVRRSNAALARRAKAGQLTAAAADSAGRSLEDGIIDLLGDGEAFLPDRVHPIERGFINEWFQAFRWGTVIGQLHG